MTFSLLLRDPETGEFGSVISSSSPAVAARCVQLRDGVGGVHSQNITDPRLATRILDNLDSGMPAAAAIADVVADRALTESISYRQLLVIDRDGATAAHSGENALGIFGDRAERNAVVGGNMLANAEVLDVLLDTALTASGCVEERLLAAFRAAVAAGGEAGPLHSVGLAVVSDAGWRVTDLRVDWDDDPVTKMSELLEVWLPQRADYIGRAFNPAESPSYGVPGDNR